MYKFRSSVASAILLLLLGACGAQPDVVNPEYIKANIAENAKVIDQTGAIEDEKVSLSYALARAIKFNNDRKYALLETELARADKIISSLDALPAINASTNENLRSDPAASYSAPIIDGKPTTVTSPSYSVSASSSNSTASVSLGVDIMQIGIAREKARTAGYEWLITHEKERITTRRVVDEARSHYWRAVSSDFLEDELKKLMIDVDAALESSELQLAEGLIEPLNVLNYQRELIEVQASLLDLKRDLTGSREKLDVIMGIRPGTTYSLLRRNLTETYTVKGLMPLNELHSIAQLNNSEYLITLYEEQVVKSRSKQVWLDLLPGMNLAISSEFDDNPYKLDQSWGEINFGLTWNLLNIFKVQSTKSKLAIQKKLVEQNQLRAMLDLLRLTAYSRDVVLQDVRRLKLAEEKVRVSEEVLYRVQTFLETARGDELTVIKSRQSVLLAKHQRNIIYAELQDSIGLIIDALGIDIVPPNWQNMTTTELSKHINQNMRKAIQFLGG